MIICPNCKEEIDDLSPFCDQCGHALRYCNRCRRVGLGRRCTNCGGMMVSVDELQRSSSISASFSHSVTGVSQGISYVSSGERVQTPVRSVRSTGVPMLSLYNPSLDIRIEGIDGAVIGRKQGPYVQFFQSNMYVSGVHAQLRYVGESGWSIVDKHSSNGTRLNGRPIQPDVDMSLSDGDVVTIANVNLQVSIKYL